MDWNQLISNPLVGFVGTVIGVFGVVISIVFYLRTRRYQQPTYFKSSVKWYDGSSVPHDDIKLTFRGKEIPRFTITNLLFWNSGNQTIRASDFAPASPLRLLIPEGVEVFDVRITTVTTPEIRATLDYSDAVETGVVKEIPVHFDYLDGNDGFSIQLIHDADSTEGIKFSGKLPGVLKFRTASSSNDRGMYLPFGPTIRHTSQIQSVLATLMSIVLGLAGVSSLYSALFGEFHWYYVPGSLFIANLFFPLMMMYELNPPKQLARQ